MISADLAGKAALVTGAASGIGLAAATNVALVCPPDEARRRFKRMQQLGFDEVLLVSHHGALEELEEVRSWTA